MDEKKSSTIKINSNTPPVVIEIDQPEASKLVISNAGESGTLNISSSSPTAKLNIKDKPSNQHLTVSASSGFVRTEVKHTSKENTITLSSATPSTNINVSTAECNTYKLNSVNISDLSIEVADTITLPSGSDAYVRNLGTTKKAQLEFGIPRGEKGEKGADSVVISETEPTDPDVKVWIKPNGNRAKTSQMINDGEDGTSPYATQGYVGDGTVTFMQGETEVGSFSANQKSNTTINLPSGGDRYLIQASDESMLPDWYRIYSDGWCEQGGIAIIESGDIYVDITLLFEYKEPYYDAQVTSSTYEGSYVISVSQVAVDVSEKDTLEIINNASAMTRGMNWETKGFIDLSQLEE